MERTRFIRPLVVFAIGAAFVTAACVQMPLANGPSYWYWPWRNLNPLLVGLPFVPSFLLLAGVLWSSRREIDRQKIVGLLAILVVANFLMQIAGILAEPGRLQTVARIVKSPTATSYFVDAAKIQDLHAWLRGYPAIDLSLHSRTHPPGPILFYYFCIRLFGLDAAASLGGYLVGFVGSLGISILFHLTRWWTRDLRKRLTVCVYYALLPAMINFFPEFDQTYTVLAMLMVLFWARSLQLRRLDALWLGLTIFIATLFAYNLLTVGLFMVLYSLHYVRRRAWRPDAWGGLVRSANIALGVFILLHLVFWIVSGYNPVHGFRQALFNQQILAELLARPYAKCLVSDLYDFSLAAGILAVPLVSFRLWDGLIRRPAARTGAVLSLLGIITILVIDLTGILRCETARVWLLLQWMWIIPAGLEVAEYPRPAQYALFALQCLIIIVLKSNMQFIGA
jgi:hypothetical protein